ncbi:PepSY domain-containing protein [Roseateles chitinivorans]|uniref:PepSY domain-containing protein n=1 Tax=Roseateles chitinivorans TaxID=2917965 RepID=UPI003D67B515
MKTLNRTMKYGAFAAIALAASVAGALAYAEKQEGGRDGGKEGGGNDAVAVTQAKVSLAQAVAVAEQHLNGKASRAEYERTKQGDAYEIEVVNGNKVFDVRVDAEKGVILSSAPDEADGTGGREDREDRDEKD